MSENDGGPAFPITSSTRDPMNIAIIYHDADFDGKLSNEVCQYWLNKLHPDASIHAYGWDYGRPVPRPDGALEGIDGMEFYDQIYIVDLSVDELMARPDLRDKIVWIDHHKTAMDKWVNQGYKKYGWQFKGYRIDGVAACRLCWQWFSFANGPHGNSRTFPADVYLPSKQDFIDRKVSEPEIIRLAGEYDIWDHRDPDAKALQFGLRTLEQYELEALCRGQFGGVYHGGGLEGIIKNGRAIKSYCDKQNDEYSAAFSHTLDWEGLKFCALNIGQRGNSDLVRGGIKSEHDAIFAWRFTGNEVLVSLYHIEGKSHHDLSLIAFKHGGGGHRGACGFRTTLSKLEEWFK